MVWDGFLVRAMLAADGRWRCAGLVRARGPATPVMARSRGRSQVLQPRLWHAAGAITPVMAHNWGSCQPGNPGYGT